MNKDLMNHLKHLNEIRETASMSTLLRLVDKIILEYQSIVVKEENLYFYVTYVHPEGGTSAGGDWTLDQLMHTYWGNVIEVSGDEARVYFNESTGTF